MTSFEVEVDQSGRILLPEPVREALKLKPGSRLRAELDDQRLTLETPAPAYEIRLDERGWPTIHFADASAWPDDHDPVREAREGRTDELSRW